MAKHTPTEWIKTTIAEAFPVFFGHATYDPAAYDGPYYQPGLSFYDENREFAEWRAETLRSAGYTVSLTTERRVSLMGITNAVIGPPAAVAKADGK